jgi:hypothetical protein
VCAPVSIQRPATFTDLDCPPPLLIGKCIKPRSDIHKSSSGVKNTSPLGLYVHSRRDRPACQPCTDTISSPQLTPGRVHPQNLVAAGTPRDPASGIAA